MLPRLVDQSDATVLVGDYVNRGPAAADVLDALITACADHPLTCLAGNHDRALLEVLEGGELNRLLHMGGVPTVLSYVGAVQGDVASRLRAAVPQGHRDFLAALTDRFTCQGLLVTHEPRGTPSEEFHVYGHVVQRSLVPLIRRRSAAIDTGCGTLPDGRLTALFWPDLTVLQVDSNGELVESPGERSGSA